jgi:DNA polymerase I-like protein with 3'-5' exonuclease and polymerase domains
MGITFPSLEGQGMISIDVETRDPDLKTKGPGYHRDGYIAGIAVGTEAGFRKYYPIAHEGGGNMDRDQVLSWLRPQLALPVPKVGANLLYDLGFFRAAGVHVAGPYYDIQIAEPLLCETRLSYSLEALSRIYLDEGKKDDEMEAYLIQHFGKKDPKSNIWQAPGDVVAKYAEGDVDLPLRIFAKQKQKLEEENLWELFILESKLIPMLLDMRFRGVRVDLDKAQEMYDALTEKQAAEIAEIEAIAKTKISPWNAKDLAVLFDALELDYPRTPKTNAPSFTALWLERCPYPVAQRILDVRKMDKLRETFLKGCLLESHYKGRIHCQFNQLKSDGGGTVSGRFSSSNPNLQFIPTRTDDGKLIRSMFLPDEGQDFYSIDYSQIEYRLMAHDAFTHRLPGAAEVVEKYRSDSGVDFHQIVAEMTGLSRSAAKTVNFGIAYGEGVAKLCASLGLTEDEGRKLLDEYHSRAPFMRPLSKRASHLAATTGVITTLLGRKRRFDAWAVVNRAGETKIVHHRIPGAKRAFTHKALNARIQGSAADVMKKAMVDIYESGVCDVLGVPQLTVHDELDGSIPRTKVAHEAFEEMKNIMENTVKLSVPLTVDAKIGANWKECK